MGYPQISDSLDDMFYYACSLQCITDNPSYQGPCEAVADHTTSRRIF